MSEFNDIQDNNDNKIFIIKEYESMAKDYSQLYDLSQQSFVSNFTRSDIMESNYFDFLNDYGVNEIQDIGNIDKILLENIKNKSNSNETNEKYESLFNNFDFSNPLLNEVFLDEIIKTDQDYKIASDGDVDYVDAKLNEKKDILNDFINEDPQCINTSDNDVKSDDEYVKEVEVASEISDNTISYTNINRATKETKTRRISERNQNRRKLLEELDKAKKTKEEEEEERKRKEALNTAEGSVATGIFSNSQCSSKFLFDLSNKINLNPKHFFGSTEDGPKNFSNLLNTCCKLRHLPDTKQGDSRELSSLNISEKTQFSDIWGKKMLKYARYEEGDGLNYEILEIPKCYITKVELVSFKTKAEIGGKERACSEMEHKLPCVTAFSRAPNYILLSKYKPKNGINYLKLWNNFVNNENNFDFLHSLYVTINFREFDNDNVFTAEENIKAEFKRYIFSDEQIEEKKEKIFNWVFNVIKYWLHEFAYSHHISNQEKSIYEIGLNKKKCDTFFNKLKIAWESRNSAPAVVERSIVGKKINAIFSGPNASNKKKSLLINSLVNQFRYMDQIIKQIDEAYDAITSVQNIIDIDYDTIDKCKKILIMKNMILAYKLYKNNLKKEQILSKKRKKTPSDNNITRKKMKMKIQQDIKVLKEEEKIAKVGKVLEDFKQNIKRKQTKKKGKKGGTKKRVRFKVSRKVYRKLEHK